MSELKKCPIPGCGGKGHRWADANGVDLVICSNAGDEDGDEVCDLWFESDALRYEVWQVLPRLPVPECTECNALKEAEHLRSAVESQGNCLECDFLGRGDPKVDSVAKERDLLRAVRNSICPDCNSEGWTRGEDGAPVSCLTCHGVGYGRDRMRRTLDALHTWKKEYEGR